MPPRVSVLLPVRNAAATLARAVDAIRGQTFSAWELLAVDDGSTDDSAAILGGLARIDPRVRVIQQPARGIVAALATALDGARGEYIARMDADDDAHPERLEQQVAFLDRQPEIGVAGSLVDFGGDRAASGGFALYVDWLNSLVTPEAIALNRFIESPFAHPSVMFRRKLVAQHGGYRAGDFPEDYELWLRWAAAGVRMAKVPRVLLRWNDPPGRLSRTDTRYGPDAFFRMKAEWIARALASHDAGRGRPVWVWGAGRHTRKRASWLTAHGVRIEGYIDVDAKKATPALGGFGVPVILPDALPPPGARFVLGYVSTRGARDYIRDALRARGHEEGRDFLMCA